MSSTNFQKDPNGQSHLGEIAARNGIALTAQARKVLAEEAIQFVNHRVPCIVHIASVNFAEAIELAKHAEAVGADAISAIPPMFFAYDVNDVYNYYKAIAEAVSIPLIVYYNPNAGFNMNAGIAAKMFEIENRATDLYLLSLKKPQECGLEYKANLVKTEC